MSHSELSSHVPINKKNVCSAWEINKNLRYMYIVYVLGKYTCTVHIRLMGDK